jgi:hypothetical protein
MVGSVLPARDSRVCVVDVARSGKSMVRLPVILYWLAAERSIELIGEFLYPKRLPPPIDGGTVTRV